MNIKFTQQLNKSKELNKSVGKWQQLPLMDLEVTKQSNGEGNETHEQRN